MLEALLARPKLKRWPCEIKPRGVVQHLQCTILNLRRTAQASYSREAGTAMGKLQRSRAEDSGTCHIAMHSTNCGARFCHVLAIRSNLPRGCPSSAKCCCTRCLRLEARAHSVSTRGDVCSVKLDRTSMPRSLQTLSKFRWAPSLSGLS